MPQNTPPPGWYRDPTAVGEARYWDGTMWTNSVSRASETIDVPIEPERASLPPLPGSELRPPASAPPSVTVNAPNRSPIGAIVGGIVAIAVVIVVIVLVSNNDSSDDESPPATNAPATEAPAEPPQTEGG